MGNKSKLVIHRDSKKPEGAATRQHSPEAIPVSEDLVRRLAAVAPDSGQELRAAHMRALQGRIGNGAAQRVASPLVQRVVSEEIAAPVAKTLGVTGKVQAVEVPKAATFKASTPFSAYPPANALNLGALQDMTMLELQYPGLKDPDMEAMKADDIVDMMGGGAYNSEKDLLVLGQGYSQAALIHEMGHKAQNEAGQNTATAVISVLEYHNFVNSENAAWAKKSTDVKPRLAYANPVPRPPKPAKTWADLKTAVTARFHHDKPQTEGMLDTLKATLEGGRYQEDGDTKGKYGDQIKANLIAEYFRDFPS